MELSILPYEYKQMSALISEQAMREHHLKHHKGYVDKLNEALKDYPALLDQVEGLEVLLANPKLIPLEIKKQVTDFGGGVYTHDLFWASLSPSSTEPYFRGELFDEINATFGSLPRLKKEMIEKGKAHFGSGWVWLVVTENGLKVQTLDNQLTPLMRGHYPLLCIDLWEHAYYLDYKSDRALFLQKAVNHINWRNAQERYNKVVY